MPEQQAEQQIVTRELSNGLRVIVEPMEAVQSAAFTLRVAAGSSRDQPGHAGTASVLCELASRGAGDRNARQLSSALDNLGAQRSESVGIVHMSFSGATVADKLADVLQIYGDVVQRPHLPEEEFEAARSGVAQTLTAIEDEPRQKMLIELRRRCYDAPWGLPTDGDLEDLERITHDQVVQHYQSCFGPNDAILGIAGNVDADRVIDQVEAVFGDWSICERPDIQRVPRPGPTDHMTHDSSQTHIGLAYESVPYRDKEYYQAWAAVSLLSGGMSSRLFTEVRERRGLCYAISASLNTLRDEARVLCYAGTTNERAQETLDVTLSELRRLQDGVEEDELARCKARAKSALIMQQESTFARASAVARDWYHLGRVQTLAQIREALDALDVETILEHVRSHPPADFTIVTLGPEALDVSTAGLVPETSD